MYFKTCIFYADDLLFFAKDEADITQVESSLRDEGVDLKREDDATGFLGVKLERDDETGLIEMRQDGLIVRVISKLGLDAGAAKFEWTPVEAKPLVKNEDGIGPSGQFR